MTQQIGDDGFCAYACTFSAIQWRACNSFCYLAKNVRELYCPYARKHAVLLQSLGNEGQWLFYTLSENEMLQDQMVERLYAPAVWEPFVGTVTDAGLRCYYCMSGEISAFKLWHAQCAKFVSCSGIQAISASRLRACRILNKWNLWIIDVELKSPC